MLSNLYFRNGRLLALTILLILVAGLSAFQILPRAEDPILTRRFASVLTRLPGASAERVEALVTEKVEEELREVEEVKELQSSSRPNISAIVIELADSVSDVDEVWSRVRERLDDAQQHLPPESSKPDLEIRKVEAFAMIVALAWKADAPVEHAILQRLAEDLEDRVRHVPGVAETELFGITPEEVRVEVDPARLASLGLTTADVARAVEATDAKVAAGQFRGERDNLLIEVEGELDSLGRLRRTPIRYGEGEQVVRLDEVATVRKTVGDPQARIALLDGRPGVAIGVRMESKRRVDRWGAAMRTELGRYEKELPRGVELRLLFDQSGYTEQRLENLFANLALGALFVLGTVLFVMGWRSALLVGAALPLSVLMVFAGMNFLEIPMHQMSVTGLIIALGLLIDNAIVMVDEVRHRARDGAPIGQAVADAVRALAVPLFGSTLTTALAFAPIALMPGPAGEFVGTIAVSVILAIFSSLFLALTVVPALTGLITSTRSEGPATGWWSNGIRSRRLASMYDASLRMLLARPVLAIALAALLPAIGFWKGQELEEQFFPPTERDQFPIDLRLGAQASIGETLRVASAAREQILRNHPQVKEVHWFLGSSAPKFYYNMVEGGDDTASYGQALVQLRDSRGGTDLVNRVQRDLDAAFPEAQFVARQFEQGPPYNAPIELRLYGSDPAVLHELGEELRSVLARVPGVTHTRTTLRDGNPKLWLRTDEEQANLAGFDHRSIAGQLQTTLEGAIGGSLLEGNEELPVRIRVGSEYRADLDRIASLELLAPGRSEWTPIGALARMELRPDLSELPRRNGEQVNTVQGFLRAGLLPSGALRTYRERLADVRLPAGYRYEFGGEAEGRDDAVGNLMASVGVLVVLMIATLVLSFASFRIAGLIGAIAMLCAGLAFGALWLFDYPFGFMAIVGTMGLVGVAINDAIVVLAAIREDPRARAGDRDAVRGVVLRSTRHVLATTVTTIAGFAPLMLDGGGFWPPVAVTIAGGVAGATVLALYFVPAAYLLLMRPRSAAAPVPGALAA